ncbi:MAG: AI-2E family transporter [Phycisphaeraceae bacterium]
MIQRHEPTQSPPPPERPAPAEAVESVRQERLQRGLLTLLAVVAAGFALYAAKVVFIPLAAAGLLALLFRPVVRRLELLGIPAPLSAALLVVGIAIAAATASYFLSAPVGQWLANVPETLRQLERRVAELRQPVEQVTEATRQLSELTEGAGDEAPQVEVQGSPFLSRVLSLTTTTLLGIVVTLILMFFLLASGDQFLRKTVRLLPGLREKRHAVEAAHQLEERVSGYLLTVTLINLGLGVVLWVVFTSLGMPNAFFWAALGATANFIPYLGPVVTFFILSAGALLSFDTLSEAVWPPLAFALITAAEGYLVTPTIMGRRMELNPLVVLLSVLVWTWLWGVAGALMAVPLLVCLKIVSEHVTALESVASFLSRD